MDENSIDQLKQHHDDYKTAKESQSAADSTRDLTIVSGETFPYMNQICGTNLPSYRINMPLRISTTEIFDLFIGVATSKGFKVLQRT
jgi:hypothetical protein